MDPGGGGASRDAPGRSGRQAPMTRILHVDMDAFYASVEQRDDPELKGCPVVVGGTSRRGVVAAASYEARRYGVRSAMPSHEAARRCPGLIFRKARFDVYRAVAERIREIFRRYTDLVEPLSLDEAYLDVTEPRIGPPSGTLLARAIKDEILRETRLTASAGVATSKFLAKVASAHEKPDGLTVIPPSEALRFIARLPIESFPGVGPRTAEAMRSVEIVTGADLRSRSEEELVRRFGKRGRFFHRLAHDRDRRPVQAHRERKSIGAERTFDVDLEEVGVMRRTLEEIATKVADRMDRVGARGRTVTLKLKDSAFRVTTRQTTLERPVRKAEELSRIAAGLLENPGAPAGAVRLLGITVSSLQDSEEPYLQLSLPFPAPW